MYQNIPIIITSLLAIIVLSVIFITYRIVNAKDKITDDFITQLKVASGEDYSLDITGKKENEFVTWWVKNYGKRLIHANLVPKEYNERQVATFVFMAIVLVYIILTLIFKNLGIGLIPIGIALLFLNMKIGQNIEAKEQVFEDQIPGFLSMLKSNIQAGETPERALIGAISNTNAPLYNELKIAESLSQSGTFQSALRALRTSTSNETLRFLCGCIELSAQVGANLEEQIEIIEEMLDSKRSLKRKLAVAIAENKPLVYVSSILIPALFLFTYMSNEQTREFWFNNLISWVVFFIICGIFGFGIFFVEKMIKKTGKF